MSRLAVFCLVAMLFFSSSAQQIGNVSQGTPELRNAVLSGVTQEVNDGPSACISGVLWNDLNGNGQRDPNEPGMAGWTVRLNTGQTAVTDPNGQYSFADLGPGLYRISEEPQQAWFQTWPFDPARTSYPYAWTHLFQGTADSSAECVAVDTNLDGDILFAGHFAGTVDFDPPNSATHRTAQGQQDIFVGRLHADGSVVWVGALGGMWDDTVGDMRVDASGNVYLAGAFAWSADLDPGEAMDMHRSQGPQDGFIVRLGPDGSYLGSKVFGGPDATVVVKGLCLDGSGSLYVTGSFNATVDFDPGDGFDWHTAPGDTSVFITKLNTDGSYAWTRTTGTGGAYYGFAYGLKVRADRQGGVYVTGKFRNDVDFDPGIGTDLRTSRGDWDTFLMKLDAQGNVLWTRVIAGADYDLPYDLCLDSSGNVYLTGTYSLMADFNCDGQSDIHRTPHPKAGECFVSKFYADGRYGWTTTIGGELVRTSGAGVCEDPAGHLFVLGERTSAEATKVESRSEVFLAGLTPEGQTAWTYNWGEIVGTTVFNIGTDEAFFSPWPWGLALTSGGDIVLAGRFEGSVNFCPGDGTDTRLSTGLLDGFVTKLAHGPAVHEVTIEPGATVTGLDFGNIQSR